MDKKTVLQKAKLIELIIFDVDGILTDGGIYIDHNGNEGRRFNSLDGVGIMMAKIMNIEIAAITGSDCRSIRHRFKKLNINNIYDNKISKLESYIDLKNKLDLSDKKIAYLADDIIDIPIMKKVGLAATVKNAHENVFKYAHYTTEKQGGEGAVREFIDFILKSQKKYNLACNKLILKK